MNESMVEKVESLLDDSLDTFVDKKNFVKTQNKILKEVSEKNGFAKLLLKRCVSYKFYSGKGWLNGEALTKDASADKKDKLTPLFAKLREVIIDLNTIGALDILTPYLDKLKESGIEINVKNAPSLIINNSPEVIMDSINSACKLQTSIDELSEEISEVKAVESEEIGFTPKSSFGNVLSTFAKIKDGKGDKVEDKMQDNIANSLMTADAFNFLSKKIEVED